MIKQAALFVSLGMLIPAPANAILQCHKSFCPPNQTRSEPAQYKEAPVARVAKEKEVPVARAVKPKEVPVVAKTISEPLKSYPVAEDTPPNTSKPEKMLD